MVLYTLIYSGFKRGCFLFLCCFLISITGFGQGFTLEVGGKVEKAGKRLEGSTVTLYKGGSIDQQVNTTSNGKFNFKLEANNEYVITITKSGFITKRFNVSTRNVPVKRAEYGFGGFEFTVTIFEAQENVDYSLLDDPIAKIKYDVKSEDFNFDEAYTKSMLAALAKLKALEEQSKKEQDEKEKQAAQQAKQGSQVQQAIVDKYNAAIAKGDKSFQGADYNGAKTAFTEASKIKPEEKYPKDKIAEIDRLIAEQAKAKELEVKYKAAIAKADKAFGDKDYSNAKIAYNEASSLKANEKYPKDKLIEIDKILEELAKSKELNEKYNAAIAKGDKAFGIKDYNTAKSSYNEAVGLKAAEKYPREKLAEIDKLLADLARDKELEEKYNAAIAKADKAFAAKDYPIAKAGYNEGLGLKPLEKYPKDKLAEIDKLLADLAKGKELDEKYNAAIAKADKAFGAKDYNTAKSGYNEALGIKAAEKYPKDKLAEIDKLLADLAKGKELEEKYNAAIARADKAFGTKDYNSAKSGYNEGLALKPLEKYPKDKLAEIDKLLADLAKGKELEEKYNAAIAKADKAFGTKDYNSAKSGYSEALGIKAAEKYPKDKLAEIDKLLADLAKGKELEEKYNAAIAKADKAFGAKDYNSAKSAYNEALGIKAAEKYPKDKLAEIDKLLADLAKGKELEEKYNAAIAKADKAFGAKDYNSAKSGYNEALGIKAAEKYPKDKIEEIDKILADLSKGKELEEKYNAAIAKADKAFGAKDYNTAKSGYNEALGIKAAEKYPKDKLAEIDKLLADLAKGKELEEKYNAAIAKADKAFGAKDYNSAKSGYNEALGIKAAEKYPKDKIEEIDKILADLSKGKELEEKYNAAIAKADKAFGAKDYNSAKSGYNEGLGLKPLEKYPKDKIAEIDKLLAELSKGKELKELEEKYNAAIAKADKAFGAKDYNTAKLGYNEGLGLKPLEKYPKDKLAEIDKLLADLSKGKELEEKYNAAIAKADKAFGAKDYNTAKSGYNEALGIKAAEKYPKDKIAEIDKLLADLSKDKELEEKYNAAIARADKAFGAKDYNSAKSIYNEALALKALEKYPKDKIAQIDKLLADLSKGQELEEKYNAAIAKADKAFNGKDYTNAKLAYNEGLVLKPAEKYPKDKLVEISKLLDQLARSQELQEKYNIAIEKADKLFSSNEYKIARATYSEALGYKPQEGYPKERIAAIDELLKNQAKSNDAVNANDKSEFQSDLAAKYGPGVTEEQYVEGNCKVTKRIVVKENIADVYLKKAWNWGGLYYFKNGSAITESMFESETK